MKYELTTKTYTRVGHIVTSLVSISLDRTTKIVRSIKVK